MRKILIAAWVAMLGVFHSAVALAQEAACKLNGQEVPCDKMLEKAGGVVGWGIGMILLIGLIFFGLGIFCFVFWLLMLIHAASKPINDKVVWVLVIVFTGIIGALIYYFVVKKEFDKKIQHPVAPATPSAV
ncbi:MAG: PLDc N-terminal domain-containing protein [Candidatus Magasanikbacteria bacterium]